MSFQRGMCGNLSSGRCEAAASQAYAMETPAPISFTYGFADYLALNRLMRRDSLWKRTQLVRVPLAAALAVAGLIALQSAIYDRSVTRALGQLVVIWEFWAIVAASLPLVLILNRLELWVYYRRQRLDGTTISVSFDDGKGISSESPVGSGVIPWSSMRKLVSDADAHVLLYENRMIGLCLPRRAFAGEQAFTDTAAYIRTHLSSRSAG
jgi:hypothetical protein